MSFLIKKYTMLVKILVSLSMLLFIANSCERVDFEKDDPSLEERLLRYRINVEISGSVDDFDTNMFALLSLRYEDGTLVKDYTISNEELKKRKYTFSVKAETENSSLGSIWFDISKLEQYNPNLSKMRIKVDWSIVKNKKEIAKGEKISTINEETFQIPGNEYIAREYFDFQIDDE